MLYYLGYYSCELLEDQNRRAAPPAMNKMNYIIHVISENLEKKLMVISPAVTGIRKWMKGRKQKLNGNCELKTFDSFDSKIKPVRVLGLLLTKLEMFLFLIFNVKCDDTLIVYHSMALISAVMAVKKLKKCKLIIEVEEIYSDVKDNENLRKKELNAFHVADSYIVITELLNKKINPENKPKVISHGTYRMNPKYSEKINDGKTHLVYAGSFNPIKGGACVAIEAARYLDEKYVLHILGKGTSEEINSVKNAIDSVSKETSCKIVYEGYKSGVEFDSFIQSCHIGLSTQQPNGKYNASSFPSKILMYLTNGLAVVSVRIPAVETSDVGDLVEYYDNTEPKSIADAIMRMSTEKFNNSINSEIDDLNKKFTRELSELLAI